MAKKKLPVEKKSEIIKKEIVKVNQGKKDKNKLIDMVKKSLENKYVYLYDMVKKSLGNKQREYIPRDGVSPAKAAAGLALSPEFAPGLTKREAEARERAAAVRTRRLMKELKDIQRLQESRPDPLFTAELVDDNLFEWHVRLHQVDPDSALAGDLRRLQIPYILLHLIFPNNFPFAPPFMRVLEPWIKDGFVMNDGAICMELLTPKGWASTYTVEAVVMQFAVTVVKGGGRVADRRSPRQYSLKEAEKTFQSIVRQHDIFGWYTPNSSEG